MKSLHPFPARMAPEIALARVNNLSSGAVVLDPMAGSGTVLRQAALVGHRAIGYDLDPLAVLISRVATTPIEAEKLKAAANTAVSAADSIDGRKFKLDWIEGHPETRAFAKYWFADPQRRALRKLSYVLSRPLEFEIGTEHGDALRLALSRIIVTKEQRASLARDTSRSRPHRVATKNSFKVFPEFLRSANRLSRILADDPPSGLAEVRRGDARTMEQIEDGVIDAIVTSPPYLNAIDYLRGHKMSLIWFGHNTNEIRSIRSSSVGAERGPDGDQEESSVQAIVSKMGNVPELERRHQQMVRRYAIDLNAILKEMARVMKPQGSATFVVGNSCLRGVFISNSGGVRKAAELNGFKFIEETIRELPERNRSLPIAIDRSNALSRRMKTESVIEFRRHGNT